LIEESPSLFVDDNLRDELTSKSLQLAKKVNYVGAGTIEYLVDDDKNFYFIEMNTRIQVEHTVTEMVCMIDLVKEQIRTYAGIELSMKQEDITMSGHAIECRINAEDPFNDFIPSPKKIDSFIYAGYQIPTNYDSMLGKLIVHSSSREKALIRMKRSLQETFIEGPKTTLPLLEMIFENKDFNNGNFDINFLGKFLKNIKEKDNESS
jgi:acetyl-CoA carboxylase biotin carboxylase subunit